MCVFKDKHENHKSQSQNSRDEDEEEPSDTKYKQPCNALMSWT